jgi:mono/diheme cytochrome c family protein
MKAQLPILLLSLSSLACGLFANASSQVASKPAPKINFNKDVKPILSEHCFKCHGPDAAVLAADLRLDQFASATKMHGPNAAIVPGKPEASWLIKRVSEKNAEMRMPPPDSGVEALNPQQIDILSRWIASGAKYEEHWSLVAPKMPPTPVVSKPAWAKNLIDKFVMAQLDREHLTPEPPADRATLIRRVTFSLTGLPPTAKEVADFMADTKPGAYERVVDRLLASPAYGENQARYWLVAVRYGETH